MKTFFATFCSLFFLAVVFNSTAQQRVIAECTIEYKVSAVNSDDADLQTSLQSTVQTVYIKGNNCRIDLISPSFKQMTFFDKSTGEAVILREFGNNKFISKLNNSDWLAANKNYEDAAVSLIDETKKILGYDCKKAVLKLKNGSLLTIYYVPTLIPSVKEFQYEFKDVPGLVLDYEAADQKQNTIHYTATKLNFNPVPAQAINIPSTAGYRLLQ